MKKGMPARFLSLEFHTRFFPALLWGRLRSSGSAGTGFPSTVERHVAFVICWILVVTGAPSALSRNSIIGWVVGGVGAAGILALLLNSLFSRRGEQPSYEGFLTGVFFFFVFLGISGGVFVGTLDHSLPLGLLCGSAGLLAGYLIGIFAGIWLQYLGWLSAMVNGLAGLAVFGLIIVDLVLLAGSMFG